MDGCIEASFLRMILWPKSQNYRKPVFLCPKHGLARGVQNNVAISLKDKAMHAGHLIELSTDLCFNLEFVTRLTGKEIIHSEEFWKTSKEKLDRWNKALSLFREDLESPEANHDPWDAISCVVQEVLCSEFFARISAALFVYKDREFRQIVNGPVARAVFLFHLEARMRALELINIGVERKNAQARELNQLRWKLERWCDMLLAFFPEFISTEFSFEEQRNVEFSRDLREDSAVAKTTVRRLLKMSIHDYSRHLVKKPAANPTLNRKQFELFSFVDSFPSSTSELKNSFATQSVSDLTADAENWIEDYLTVG